MLLLIHKHCLARKFLVSNQKEESVCSKGLKMHITSNRIANKYVNRAKVIYYNLYVDKE